MFSLCQGGLNGVLSLDSSSFGDAARPQSSSIPIKGPALTLAATTAWRQSFALRKIRVEQEYTHSQTR